MDWTDFQLTVGEMETVLKGLGIDPDDYQTMVDRFEEVEAAALDFKLKQKGLKRK